MVYAYYIIFPFVFLAYMLIIPILYAKFGLPVVEALNFPADISEDATTWAFHGVSLLFFREPPFPSFYPEGVEDFRDFSLLDQCVSYFYLVSVGRGGYLLIDEYAEGLKGAIENLEICKGKLAKYKTRPKIVSLFEALKRLIKQYIGLTLFLSFMSVLVVPWIFFSFVSLLMGDIDAFFWCAVAFVTLLIIATRIVKISLIHIEQLARIVEKAEDIRRLYQEYEVAERELEVRQSRGS